MAGKIPSPSKRHAQVQILNLFGATTDMGPIGLWVYARYYLSAAQAVPKERFMPARDYLACHAIELLLKSFLALRGYTLLELTEARFGHKLDILLTEAEAKGLADLVALSPEQKSCIMRAAFYYGAKLLEYPSLLEATRAYADAPATDSIIAIGDLLLAALEEPCSAV